MATSTANVPDSVLAEFPVAQPPPGITSDFLDPPNSGWKIVIVGAVLLPIMIVFMGIRTHVKFNIVRKASWDDLTCLLAGIGTIIYYTTIVLAVSKGHFGRHAWDISVLMAIQPWFAVPVYIINWLGTVILPFTKITFFIFYLQLFHPLKWMRISCYTGISFTIVVFTGFFVAQMALETPHPGESWLEMNQDPRELYSLKHLSIPITASSFAIDSFTFILPMAAVSGLKLSFRRKFGVVLVFVTGLAAILSSFLGLYYKIQLNSHADDPTWHAVPVSIALLTEMSVGVICACMPSLARFVGHQFPNFSILDTLVSLKLISYIKTRTRTRTDSRVVPPGGSKSVRHPFQRVTPRNLTDENLTQSMDADGLELDHGATASAKTRIVSGSNEVQMNDISGIHMQREWAVRGEISS